MEKTPNTIELTVVVSNAQAIELQGGGIGTISRRKRFEAHPDNEQLAQQAETELSQGLHNESTVESDITRCGDGRGAEDNNGGLQGFGGTAGEVKTLTIAGLLDDAIPVDEHVKAVATQKKSNGKKSGAHRADTDGNKSKCGCGECDGAHDAFKNYIDKEQEYKGLVTGLWSALGYNESYGQFDDTIYSEIITTLSSQVESGYYKDGFKQVDAIAEIAGEDAVEDLIGKHKEVVWVLNKVSWTKFAQDDFLNEYDSFDDDAKGIHAFWEDQWGIEKNIQEIAGSDDTMRHKLLTSDLVRRVATAANLTQADLHILILT